MFGRVLFPTDFSEWADRTLARIREIPGVVEVLLLHVTEPQRTSVVVWDAEPAFEPLYDYTARRLEEYRTVLEEQGIRTRTLREAPGAGGVAGAIVGVAEREGVDLIVMGARRKGFLTGLLLGSVSGRVLRESGCHILLMQFPSPLPEAGPGGGPLFSRILCAVDLSRPSIETARALAGLRDVHLLALLHVVAERSGAEGGEAEKALGDLARSVGGSGTEILMLIREGAVGTAILEAAQEMQATLIAMARYGRRDYIRQILLGATSSEVARRALVPVLVLNPRLELQMEVRELGPGEFPLAEEVWISYHQQTADWKRDRIFGVFLDGFLVAVARCRQHEDGHEVDGVFTREEFRGKGYARQAVRALVEAFPDVPLFMHSTLELVDFYRTFGFEPVPEAELPRSIRERFAFASGDMRAMHVQPMRRLPPSRGASGSP